MSVHRWSSNINMFIHLVNTKLSLVVTLVVSIGINRFHYSRTEPVFGWLMLIVTSEILIDSL